MKPREIFYQRYGCWEKLSINSILKIEFIANLLTSLAWALLNVWGLLPARWTKTVCISVYLGCVLLFFFSSGLSLGRIDALGRFEADFEPEPEARRESRLSRLARRLKRQPQDQEELAWRVAEMIVRDVTSITLAPQPPEHPPSTGGSWLSWRTPLASHSGAAAKHKTTHQSSRSLLIFMLFIRILWSVSNLVTIIEHWMLNMLYV